MESESPKVRSVTLIVSKSLEQDQGVKWTDEPEEPPDPLQSSVDDASFLKRQKRRLSESPVLHKINDAKKNSNSNFSLLRKLVILLTTSTCFTILMTLFMFIPISKIVMGSVFYDECPVQPIIPLYLLIGGIVAVFRDLANICLRSTLTDESYFQYEIPITVTAFLYTFAEFVWFVYGSVQVYDTFGNYQWMDRKEENYCSVLLYMYAFVITTVSYFLLVMTCAISCATLCLAKFLENEMPEREKGTTIVIIQNA